MKSLFATWAQWKRPRVWELGVFSCCLSCAIYCCAMMRKQDPASVKLKNCKDWGSHQISHSSLPHCSHKTSPSSQSLWPSSHLAEQWRSPSFPSPEAKQGLSSITRSPLQPEAHFWECPWPQSPPPCLASAVPSQEPIDFLLLKYINVIKVRITQPGICDLQP